MISAHFLEGRYAGSGVRTRLTPQGPAATLVEESYLLPGLPSWPWVAWLLKPWVMAKVNGIWKEDLDVGVCMDGWPGLPEAARADAERQEMGFAAGPLPESLTPAQIPEGRGRCYRAGDQEIAVFNVGGRLHALDNRCPHTGGPLALGRVTDDGQCVECPWHGARFKLATGEHIAGPGHGGVAVIDLSSRGCTMSRTAPTSRGMAAATAHTLKKSPTRP